MKYYNISGILCKAENADEAKEICLKHYKESNDADDFCCALYSDILNSSVIEIDDSISNDNFKIIAETVAERYNSKIENTIDGWIVQLASTPHTSAVLTYGDVYCMKDKKGIDIFVSISSEENGNTEYATSLLFYDDMNYIMDWVDKQVKSYTDTKEYKEDAKERNKIKENIKRDIFKLGTGWISVVDDLPETESAVCVYGSKIIRDEKGKIHEVPFNGMASYSKKTKRWISEENDDEEEYILCVTHWIPFVPIKV